MDEEKKDESKKKPNSRSPARPKNYITRSSVQNIRAVHRGRQPHISPNHVNVTSNGHSSQEMAMQLNQGPPSFRPLESNAASTQTQQNGGPVDHTSWSSTPQHTTAGLNDIGGLQDGLHPSNDGFHRTHNSQTLGLNNIGRLNDGPSNDGFHSPVNSQTLGLNDIGQLHSGTRPSNRNRTNNGHSPPRRRARRPQVGNSSSGFNASHSPTGSRSFGQPTRPPPPCPSQVTSHTADFQSPPIFVPDSPPNIVPEIDPLDSFEYPYDGIFIPEFNPFNPAVRSPGWSPFANLSQDQLREIGGTDHFLRGLGTEDEPFELLRPGEYFFFAKLN